MLCKAHAKQATFICIHQNCDFVPLCRECRRKHLEEKGIDQGAHSQRIKSTKLLIEQANDQLASQLGKLQAIKEPFTKLNQIRRDIDKQKRNLEQQKHRILHQIQQVFADQMRQLQLKNKHIFDRYQSVIPFESINQKQCQIEQLQRQLKLNVRVLKRSLAYSIQPFLKTLSKKKQLTSIQFIQSNQYYQFDDIKHNFFLSRLTIKKKKLGGQPLTKIFNETNFYFLIDRNLHTQYQTSTLYYFSSIEQLIRLYDAKLKIWKAVKAPSNIKIPQFGCSVHDPQTDRFYCIGGGGGIGTKAIGMMLNYDSKTENQIIWYDRKKNKWEVSKSRLNVGRTSAMCALIRSQQGNKIIVVGGLMPDLSQKASKSCQLYDIESQTIKQISNCNFATSSSTLINFNDNIIFKIGGLGNFSDKQVLCEIVQKIDLGQYIRNNGEGQIPPWTYIDLQDTHGAKLQDKTAKLFYAWQAGIQINQNEMFIFGGVDHNGYGTSQSYIISVQSIKNSSNKANTRYFVRWINYKPLLTGQGFRDLKPTIYDGKLYCLQNISVNQDTFLEKQKKVLEFDMYQWKQTESFVPQ